MSQLLGLGDRGRSPNSLADRQVGWNENISHRYGLFRTVPIEFDLASTGRARSLLQLLRGQPIQQEWVEDYVFRATRCKGLVWPDYYDFGGGLISVSHKLKSHLSSFCSCSFTTYQFLTPNWEVLDASAISVSYSILNVLDMRPDALLSHHDRIGLNRSGQLDARRSIVVDSTKVSGCDHLVRLSASLIIAVDTLAMSLAEGDLVGFRLTELSCDAPDIIETEQGDKPNSR